MILARETTSPAMSSSVPVGAIVGAIVGSAALLGVVVFTILIMLRRSRRMRNLQASPMSSANVLSSELPSRTLTPSRHFRSPSESAFSMSGKSSFISPPSSPPPSRPLSPIIFANSRGELLAPPPGRHASLASKQSMQSLRSFERPLSSTSTRESVTSATPFIPRRELPIPPAPAETRPSAKGRRAASSKRKPAPVYSAAMPMERDAGVRLAGSGDDPGILMTVQELPPAYESAPRDRSPLYEATFQQGRRF